MGFLNFITFQINKGSWLLDWLAVFKFLNLGKTLKNMLTLFNTLILQLPMGTPNPDDNQPLDLSDPFELIVFIVLPILAVFFYILWRKKRKDKN